MSAWDSLKRAGVIPVVRMDTPEHAVPLARALVRGGLPAAEVTFRSSAAAESIRAIASAVPELFVCAGTILTVEQAEQAADMGAEAIVSPGANPEVIRWCRRRGLLAVPGCATPTEAEACMREGLELVKIFPAEILGGVAFVRALAGPYPGLSLMPTGGIRPENAAEYLRQKNVLACGGTWIVPEPLLRAGAFGQIEQLAREAAAIRDGVLRETEKSAAAGPSRA